MKKKYIEKAVEAHETFFEYMEVVSGPGQRDGFKLVKGWVDQGFSEWQQAANRNAMVRTQDSRKSIR